MESADVIVIGAGPGGLAAAAALGARGIRPIVLDRADVGASWRGHYERLHLHTPRRLSGMPGMPIPRRFGRWVARDDVVRYLEEYRDHHRLDVRTGVEVARIGRDGDGWVVLDTAGGRWSARDVVVATGYNHTPLRPTWPGEFTGTMLAAADYRNAGPYAAGSALVVGAGNTGCEIAQDLAGAGSSPVWLAVRTSPYIVRRARLGWPAQGTGILIRRLPPRLVDRLDAATRRLEVPDLSRFGLPEPRGGLYTRALAGATPVQDVGVVAAIENRSVVPVPTIASFDGSDVVLVDGRRLTPDVIVVAAGYRRNLEPLVGHLGVLTEHGSPVVNGAHNPPGAPGLWFIGFTAPISGVLREVAIDARRIARAIASSERS